MKTIHYEATCVGNMGDWKGRHRFAIKEGIQYNIQSHQTAIVKAIQAWCIYAVAHQRRFESPIGQDYVLGPMWKAWGLALRGLLNGDTGQLDCGTLDTILVDNIVEQFPEETF